MKNPLIFFFLVALALAACNSSSNLPILTTSNSKTQDKLTDESEAIIDEYNQIILNAPNEENEQVTQQKLESIFSKTSKINSDKERNNIQLSILMRNGNYLRAYELTEEILSKKQTSNMKSFQCLLMESIHKTHTEIQECYSDAAQLYQETLADLDKNNPLYPHIEWAYFANLFHSGKVEYKDKLKRIVDSQKTVEDKQTFQMMYEMETNLIERRSLLESKAGKF